MRNLTLPQGRVGVTLTKPFVAAGMCSAVHPPWVAHTVVAAVLGYPLLAHSVVIVSFCVAADGVTRVAQVI